MERWACGWGPMPVLAAEQQQTHLRPPGCPTCSPLHTHLVVASGFGNIGISLNSDAISSLCNFSRTLSGIFSFNLAVSAAPSPLCCGAGEPRSPAPGQTRCSLGLWPGNDPRSSLHGCVWEALSSLVFTSDVIVASCALVGDDTERFHVPFPRFPQGQYLEKLFYKQHQQHRGISTVRYESSSIAGEIPPLPFLSQTPAPPPPQPFLQPLRQPLICSPFL